MAHAFNSGSWKAEIVGISVRPDLKASLVYIESFRITKDTLKKKKKAKIYWEMIYSSSSANCQLQLGELVTSRLG